MVLGFGRDRSTKFEAETKHRLARMENIYGRMLDSTLKLMERATNLESELSGLVPGREAANGQADFVSAAVAWVKEAGDIPDMAKKPIMQWLNGRKVELNSVANGFIDNQVKAGLEKALAPKQEKGA